MLGRLQYGRRLHSFDHHRSSLAWVQISPFFNNSYTIMNKGGAHRIELQGEMEKIHNARAGTETVGRRVVQAPMQGVGPENIREEGRRSQAWRPALRRIEWP